MNTPATGLLLELARRQLQSHALVLIDPLGCIVDWLAGAERIFGYRADEAIGKDLGILFVPEDLARGLDVWERQTAASAGSAEDDRWQLRKDGLRIWVTGTLTPLRDETGTLRGFLKLMRERTSQKEQLEAIEHGRAALQHAERQRVQFVSTLAHELRNPIGTIGNAVAIVDRSAEASPEVRFAASLIRRQAEFMGRLVGDLLEVARSTVGKVKLHKERLSLQNVLAQSLDACRGVLEARAHRVHRLLPDVAIEVDGDRVRLQQVFVNLIENAAKYTPAHGTIWIKLTTEGDEAVVHVRDTGVGISAELMPHVFELFTQGESATRAQGGLGIGLALVLDTVTLHGGTVQAASDGTGKGSQFTVRLPLPDARDG